MQPHSMRLGSTQLQHSRRRLLGSLITAALIIVSFGLRCAHAQIDTARYPREQYFIALASFREGEFSDAAQGFRAAARGGLRNLNGPWVDGICYYTMAGECFYQMGDPVHALEQYTAALNVFVSYNSWLIAIQFPPSVNALDVSGPPINWGTKTRRSLVGNFPEWAHSGLGRIDNTDVIRQGGVVQPAKLINIHINEVARCIAVSLRRRAELLGPAAQHDSLNSKLVSVLAARPAPPNHWSEAWVDCWLGLAYVNSNKHVEAGSSLQNSLLAAGQYDHPLTAIALLELGKLAFRQEQYDKAASYFLEATYPAATFGQYDILEEAFRFGSLTQLVTGNGSGYAPLTPALAWSDRRESRYLQASLMLEAAEHLMRSDVNGAAVMLDNARRAMLRRDMSAGLLGGRHQYLLAQANYLSGNMSEGDAAFAKSMSYYQKSSLWLFQIAMADKIARSMTEHSAHELYSVVLREPQPNDWAWQPAETFAVVTAPALAPWEHWFELAIRRDDPELALEIADRIRRKQFFSAIPIGGRLLAFRWVLDAPQEALSDTAQRQRQNLLEKYPALAELAEKAKGVREQLDAQPDIPADMAASQRQQELLTQLANISAAQEALLRPLSVGREPCEFAFPPLSSVQDLLDQLPEKHAVVVFFATSRDAYGFLLTRGATPVAWRVTAGSRVRNAIAALLKEIGNFDGNTAISQKDVANENWKSTSRILFQMMFNLKGDSDENPLADFEEIVIVPHGVLWYLPFEMLHAGPADAAEPLIAKTRIRYAPLLSLAVPDKRRIATSADTVLIAGKLHPQEPDTLAGEFSEQLAAEIPGVRRLTKALAPTHLLATIYDRLLVYADIDANRMGPFGWKPMPIDDERVDGSVAAWMALPFGAPQQIILPGFHTRAEASLKRGADGSEIFLTVCGLMASGSRSVLLSRWRVGGESTRSLLREYLQELPHQSPASAWQRSVLLLWTQDLDVEGEPRLNRPTFQDSVKGEFPFFWSGYMLIDRG